MDNLDSHPHGSLSGLKVAVWRTWMLSGSETFIRNQQDNLLRWEPVAVGTKKVTSPISRSSDYILFGTSFLSQIFRAIFKVTRKSIKLERWLRREEISLVHAHFLTDAVLIVPTLDRLSIPLVVTVHGFDVTQRKSASRWTARRELETLIYANRIVAVSNFTKDCAVALGAPPEKTVVSYIGTYGRAARPANEKDVDLLFVGRLVEKKGVADLIAAVAMLESEFPKLRVKIVGSGPLRADLESMSEGLACEVLFVDSLPPADVESAMASARIFVAPSKRAQNGDSEGFGMVFLEAAVAAIPVVSYSHGGVPEAVLHEVTGLLAKEGDVRDLASHIARLLRDPVLAAKLGQAGRERAIRDFDVKHRTHNLERLFDEVEAESRSKSNRQAARYKADVVSTPE